MTWPVRSWHLPLSEVSGALNVLIIGRRAPRMSGQRGLRQPLLAGSAAARVVSCDRTNSTSSAGAFDGEPVSKGGCGSYSMASWRPWAICGPCRRARRVRAMSMPADTPTAVITFPVFHHPLLGVAGAAAFQLVGPGPVGGGVLPLQDARGGQVDGPGADAGGPGGGGVNPAQPLHHRLVGFLGGQGAADDHDIRCCHLVQAGGCDQLAPAGVVGDRSRLGGHEYRVMTGDEASASKGPMMSR